MAPTIVYNPDGSVRLALGAAGGPTIIAQIAKALVGVLDWSDEPLVSIDLQHTPASSTIDSLETAVIDGKLKMTRAEV